MKNTIILIFILLIGLQAPCQTKKERKRNKVKATTEWETSVIKGETKTYKTTYEEFDRDGHSTLKIDYAPDGSITYKTTATYNSFGSKTAETELDPVNNINLMRTYRYNAQKDRTEESEFNSTGEFKGKTVYTYDASGNRTSETETDATGNMVRKTTFTYNSKNLKTERTTTSAAKAATNSGTASDKADAPGELKSSRPHASTR